jgi:hypothetical protein
LRRSNGGVWWNEEAGILWGAGFFLLGFEKGRLLFCKKEAKNFLTLVRWLWRVLGAHGLGWVSGGVGGEGWIHKVFLLLFVHKKKALLALGLFRGWWLG